MSKVNSEWLSIDTAPTDGTMILALAEGWYELPVIIRMRENGWYDCGFDVDNADEEEMDYDECTLGYLKEHEPTHWVPLPKEI